MNERTIRIALTGGIACGKSLVARHLNACGVRTVDADDIVHELVPEAERRRLARVVFADPAARKALEARLHPLVRARLEAAIAASTDDDPVVCIIPLLFEVQWHGEFDIICCVTSEKATQVGRMVTTRGYSREEAESRLRAQLPVGEKAAKSHYVIVNEGSEAELREKVGEFVRWLRNEVKERRHGR